MAAPVKTVRQYPDGFRLTDGYQSLITFGDLPDARFWELEVSPPGVDGGDPINTTTMHNVAFRTMAARALYTLSPFPVKAAYDPCFYDDITNYLINEPMSITVTFPDGSTLVFWGYLQQVQFDPLVEGEMPTLTLTVVPTNYDPNNCVEAAPVLTCVGTC